jgi:formate/nitrite transporter
MAELFGSDAFSPRDVAERVRGVCVTKARLPFLTLWMLSMLAGAFIGLGALYATLVVSDTATLGFAVSRVLAGLVFSLGLILVVVAGAELFTGNNLLAMAWADGCLTTGDVLRNWAVTCAGNFVGAAGLALLVWVSGHASLNDGAVARTAIDIATAKAALPLAEAFFRGVLCNVLVCMAVWMAMAGRSVVDKAVAIVFPISAFVAAGFEHSIANMYLFPLAMLLGAPLGWGDFARNLAPVIAGNLVGGSVLVALVYWVIYIRPERRGRAPGADASPRPVSPRAPRRGS